ncbi:MAG: hypothetical protein IJT32_03665 [Lachnospiraceae bacterium]|nr:hypothetical protein [Lachnospiraceae bacterium]
MEMQNQLKRASQSGLLQQIENGFLDGRSESYESFMKLYEALNTYVGRIVGLKTSSGRLL